MATRITFSADVGQISTASNTDGSIRWHAYTRPFGNGRTIFVQREVNGTLEAEVRLLAEGSKPEVYFDANLSKWLLFYVLNENAFLITADENDPIATQPSQTDTTQDTFATNLSRPTNLNQVAQQLYDTQPGIGSIYTGPPAVAQLQIGAGTSDSTLGVRWVPKQTENELVAGFLVFLLDPATKKYNQVGTFEPYSASATFYEQVVPKVAGTYFVVQVNYQGNVSQQLSVGRIQQPSDNVDDNSALDRFNPRIGDGLLGDFVFVDRTPVLVIRSDTFKPRIGGNGEVSLSFVTYEPIQAADEADTIKPRYGDGFTASLEQTGSGGVIIG